MNILFLTHPYPNFVPDLLLHGLRRLLGHLVVDYPKKDTLYKGMLLGIEPDENGIKGWEFADEGVDRTDIDLKVAKGFFDYILCDIRAIKTSIDILAKSKNIAYIDGEDAPTFWDLGRHIIFRRETDGTDMSIPLPMALPEELFSWISSFDNEPKKYSVCFIGAYSELCPERLAIAKFLQQCYPDSFIRISTVATNQNKLPEGRLKRAEYYKIMQSSHIVLNIKGAGFDTFRFWENSACLSVHLSQYMPLYIPEDFNHGVNILRFANIIQLRQLIDDVLGAKIDTQSLIHNQRLKLLRDHLTTHRAKYVLIKLRQHFR